MFWKLTSLSASSPLGTVRVEGVSLSEVHISGYINIILKVESVLDKEDFTLEELLDEEEIIQECKALNSRLINFLRDRAQVEQLLKYVVEEPSEDADSKLAFKFPFISCEIFTCEIDVILKTLVEDEELMNLLFSFLDPTRPHSALLAGYFSKVVVCLMVRKTIPLMNYVQVHQNVFRQLVDLIGITSIMEVLIRLVGADDHVYPNFMDVMQWLAESDLLEMIVDKLRPSSSPEVQANAAETLCAITRTAPSALANKLSSTSFVTRVFDHALEESHSNSGLVHALSVCISLLDPRRSAVSFTLLHSFRNQHNFEPPVPVNQETLGAMLPKIADLLKLLNVSSNDKILPTTYGELRPPLGKHRLKIVEFIAVLFRAANEVAENELVVSGIIGRVLDLFFEYPYNNALHHHVESIIMSCLESKNEEMIDHLLRECNLVEKIVQAEKHPILSGDNKPTIPTSAKQAPRSGYIGHITRISNKLVQLACSSSQIKRCLQENSEWNDWQVNVLQERNNVENVYRWACGRPTAMQDRMRDSDDDDQHDHDYDVTALANNLSQAFRYKIYDNNDNEEDHGPIDQDEEDVYFDDESAEVVISSLRLGDDQGSSVFTNANWFAYQDNRFGNNTSSEMMDEINLNGTTNSGNSSSDDEVVVGEDDELMECKDPLTSTSSGGNNGNVFPTPESESITSFRFDNESLFADQTLPEWARWGESTDMQISGSNLNPFVDDNSPVDIVMPDVKSHSSEDITLPNGSMFNDSSVVAEKSPAVLSLFEEDVEFVGVEPEGTEKAMEQALKEGIVGEAGPLKRSPKSPEKENSGDSEGAVKEFNDANFWRVDQEVVVSE